MRYDPAGRTCIQRVDLEPGPAGALVAPVAVASGIVDGRSFVYVVDSATNQVAVYRRRD
jgi:hypothetical protein